MPAPAPVRFGRFELDVSARQLWADGSPVALGTRALDLLLLLIERAPHPVSPELLKQAVWPGRRVADSNVRVQIKALRQTLGDEVIEHLPGKGYRLMLPLDEGLGGPARPEPAAGNLPLHLPPLFGRELDRETVGARLQGTARVTLVGTAGAGKSLLALAIALDRRPAFAEGAWWIDLAPLADAAQLASALASALSLPKGDEDQPLEAIVRALARGERLIILDNCEHLVSAVCTLADALMRHAPGVAVLATSRRTLKFAGEHAHPVGALSLPEAPGLRAARRSAALALFECRARRAHPGFGLTEDNVGPLTEVCRQLDGNALAIELAAARLPLLGPAGLRDRLADRLRLLGSIERDTRGQDRSLRAALDWSHGLLPPREQAVLRRLGAFSGSFALGAVQAVLSGLPAGDAAAAPPLDDWTVLEALNVLLDHSLLVPLPGALLGNAVARFTLHESVRLYARERLAAHEERPALLHRHARAMLARVTGRPGLAGDEDDADRDCMSQLLDDADHDNLRAAWQWAFEHDIDLSMRLLIQANAYLRQRGHHREVRQWHLRLLSDPRAEAHPRRLARVGLSMAALCYEQHALDEVLVHAQAAIERLAREPDARSLGEAHAWLGSAHHARRDFEAAVPAFQRSIACHREAGYEVGVGDQLNNLGILRVEQGRHAEAGEILQQALQIQRRLGGDWGMARSLENLGEAAWARGDPPDAVIGLWQQALEHTRKLGNLVGEAMLLNYLALAARRAGRADEAYALLQVSLSISRPRQLPGLVGDAVTALAALQADQGDLHGAARLLGAAEAQRSRATVTGPLAIELPSILAAVQGGLSARDWHAALAEGQRLDPHDIDV